MNADIQSVTNQINAAPIGVYGSLDVFESLARLKALGTTGNAVVVVKPNMDFRSHGKRDFGAAYDIQHNGADSGHKLWLGTDGTWHIKAIEPTFFHIPPETVEEQASPGGADLDQSSNAPQTFEIKVDIGNAMAMLKALASTDMAEVVIQPSTRSRPIFWGRGKMLGETYDIHINGVESRHRLVLGTDSFWHIKTLVQI